MTATRHESLEAVFFASVPPRPVPWPKRALWWWLLLALENEPALGAGRRSR